MCVPSHVQRSEHCFRPIQKLNHRSRIRGVTIEPPRNDLGGPIFSKDTVSQREAHPANEHVPPVSDPGRCSSLIVA